MMLKYLHHAKDAVMPLAVSMVVWLQSASAQTREFSSPLKASQLKGEKVEDTDGQKVGVVHNLIVDTRSGQLRYLVIASGGILGVGSTLRVAPSQIMSAATTKRETLFINTTLARLKAAPAFKPSQLATLAVPGRAQQIARYYREPEVRMSVPGLPLRATARGRSARANAPPDALSLASDLLGKEVVDRQNERIGQIVDLLVDFGEHRPTFAIISTRKLLSRGREYAISLKLLGSGKPLVLNAVANTLQGAPLFNRQVWETADFTDKPAIYRYSKAGE